MKAMTPTGAFGSYAGICWRGRGASYSAIRKYIKCRPSPWQRFITLTFCEICKIFRMNWRQAGTGTSATGLCKLVKWGLATHDIGGREKSCVQFSVTSGPKASSKWVLSWVSDKFRADDSVTKDAQFSCMAEDYADWEGLVEWAKPLEKTREGTTCQFVLYFTQTFQTLPPHRTCFLWDD